MKKITYFDNTSGVKSAALNGQNCPSGTVLARNGDYKFTIADFADNTREINLKIQK